jgi:hypothetical protein
MENVRHDDASLCGGNGPIEKVFPFRVPNSQGRFDDGDRVSWMGAQHVGVSSVSTSGTETGNATGSHVESRRRVDITFGTGCTGLKHGVVAPGGAECGGLNLWFRKAGDASTSSTLTTDVLGTARDCGRVECPTAGQQQRG